jgi:glutamine kinase
LSKNKTSKANNLSKLLKNQKKFIVPIFITIFKKDLKDKSNLLKKINKVFKQNELLIVRSSSFLEDTLSNSNAGKFLSISNVKNKNQNVIDAIKNVAKRLKNEDQIIIQKFISGVDLSGVIFTRDPKHNSPYYIINYDKSRKTDLITSGKINPSINTKIIFRKVKSNGSFSKLIDVVKKIEKIFKSETLDIEFAIKRKKIFIFQCRNLIIKSKLNLDNEIEIALNNLKKKIIKLKKENPFLPGKTTYFSNMSDWNPAEMIGTKPNPLSISLYSELITNEIWAIQRKNYGYKNVIPNPLMVNFAGSPYIDLRTDLNSFIPKNLNQKFQEKVINNCLNKIKIKPEIHDKIEFNCIETSSDFSSYKLSKLEKTYTNEIINLTENLIKDKNLLKNELDKIKNLEKKIKDIERSRLSKIHKIYYHIYFCKHFGTLPFAGAARLAFIATKFLKSLLNKNEITHEDIEKFYQQPSSVSNLIKKDFINLKNKKIRKKEFLEKYGHLRPQTYNIVSENYKDGFKDYFDLKENLELNLTKKIFISSKINKKIRKYISKNNYSFSTKDFINFAINSIHAREYCKFIFTKSLDKIFSNIKDICREIKIKVDDVKYVNINTFLLNLNSLSPKKLKDILENEIKTNKKNYKILEKILLPDVIFEENDIYSFDQKQIKGNYITNKEITSKIFDLEKIKSIKDIKNKIVLIENADPGYDFLFSYDIKGLITKYGGVNSHMSIRCLELGIPSIIGIGEKNYELLRTSNKIHIDCSQKIYKIIN